jgi:hypothetical protein
MSIRWTMEAVWAAIAVITTVAGGFYTSVYRWGSLNSRVDSVVAHQGDQDRRIDANNNSLSDQKQIDSRIDQKLDDAIGRLDRIEKKL